MTPSAIAAQEQRLARLAALHAKPRTDWTIEDHGLRSFLAAIIRRDSR